MPVSPDMLVRGLPILLSSLERYITPRKTAYDPMRPSHRSTEHPFPRNFAVFANRYNENAKVSQDVKSWH